jgi:hypothetical protein
MEKLDFEISVDTEIEFTPINTGDDGVLHSNHNIQNVMLEHVKQIQFD